MSIIHDALKKTNQPVMTTTRAQKNKVNWGPLLVVAVLILITAPILAPVFRDLSSSPTAARGQAAGSSNMKSQFAIEEAPLMPTVRPAALSGGLPQFSLTGLIYSPDGSYCLINGRVVKVGESVSGAKLVNVTPSEAVLEYQGKRIILPANI